MGLPPTELVAPKKTPRQLRLELHQRRLGIIEPTDMEPETDEEDEQYGVIARVDLHSPAAARPPLAVALGAAICRLGACPRTPAAWWWWCTRSCATLTRRAAGRPSPRQGRP